MNFFVTGGAGFIGSHVCEKLLQEGHLVSAFDDLNDFYSPLLKSSNLSILEEYEKQFTFIKGDIQRPLELLDALSTRKFDQIIHLAARTGVSASLEQPALYQDVNVTGTVQVLEAARKLKIKKITIASSSSVYGNTSKVQSKETDPVFAPVSPYGASKLGAEALGHVYYHLYGMDIVMLRLFTVYGPRQHPNLAITKFASLIHAGMPISVFGDGSSARDYTYVSDVVAGVVACTKKYFGYEIFNLGESRSVSLLELILNLEAALGKEAIIEYHPCRPCDVPMTCANIDKACSKLGYKPQVKFKDGLKLFVQWFIKSAERNEQVASS